MTKVGRSVLPSSTRNDSSFTMSPAYLKYCMVISSRRMGTPAACACTSDRRLGVKQSFRTRIAAHPNMRRCSMETSLVLPALRSPVMRR